jgi:hypothetical protein
MRIADPTPVAKGLAVAAACLVGIPTVCRFVETHPALGFAALLVILRLATPATRSA